MTYKSITKEDNLNKISDNKLKVDELDSLIEKTIITREKLKPKQTFLFFDYWDLIMLEVYLSELKEKYGGNF